MDACSRLRATTFARSSVSACAAFAVAAFASGDTVASAVDAELAYGAHTRGAATKPRRLRRVWFVDLDEI